MHAGDPTGGVPGEGEGEQGQQTYQAEMFTWLQKIYKWQPWIVLYLIMLCFFLLKLYLIEKTIDAQTK